MTIGEEYLAKAFHKKNDILENSKNHQNNLKINIRLERIIIHYLLYLLTFLFVIPVCFYLRVLNYFLLIHFLILY